MSGGLHSTRYFPVSRTAEYFPAVSDQTWGIQRIGEEGRKNMTREYASGLPVRLSVTVPTIFPVFSPPEGPGVIHARLLLELSRTVESGITQTHVT